jgi:hypothetical protein
MTAGAAGCGGGGGGGSSSHFQITCKNTILYYTEQTNNKENASRQLHTQETTKLTNKTTNRNVQSVTTGGGTAKQIPSGIWK